MNSENFNRDGKLRKYYIEVTELKNTIIKLKNTLEGFKIRTVKEKKESVNWETG